jgi:hypothetical protein
MSESKFSLVCNEMGRHQATLTYEGEMCRDGALALEHQFERLFGYFKYCRIDLCIESPGGEITGLEYVLRAMDRWAKEGRYVAVRSTFQCASAAACLLSMGEWGRRSVDRSTFLLFHCSRVQSEGQSQMTARISKQLSTTLDDLDRRLLDVIVGRMLTMTGGTRGLVDMVLRRARFLDADWVNIAANLSTLTSVVKGERKPDWLKTVMKWERFAADSPKFVQEMKKHLVMRFQSEQRMDLCEAFVLLLIDEISGVLNAESTVLEIRRPAELPTVAPADQLSANDETTTRKMGER